MILASVRSHTYPALLALLLLIAPWAARADRVSQESYAFEYKSPVIATVTDALARSNAQELGLRFHDMSVEVLPGRGQVPLIEGNGKLRFRFYPQNDTGAPLVFVLAGLGGGPTSGTEGYIADRLAQAGFQVITIASPFHWAFLIAAGENALPGVMDEDSMDVHRAMHAAYRAVLGEYSISPRSLELMGMSMGAVEAAMIAGIDSRSESPFQFRRVLIMNPPVDLAYGSQVLDGFYAVALKLGEQHAHELMGRVYDLGENLLKVDIESPAYWANLLDRFPLSEDEARFLIGASFHQSLSDVIFASQQIHDLGILKVPATKYERNGRLDEAAHFMFQHYLNFFVLPTWGARHGIPNPTIEDLRPHSSLRPLEAALKSDSRIYLMHNADDFLLAPGDLEWLESVFGDRAKIYPYGGHLGNIWFPQNRADMIQILKQ